MTKDEFFKGISKTLNKVLMRVFKDMDLVEQLGSGMDRNLSVYDRSIFEISDNYIRVSFKYNDGTAISGDKTTMILDQKETVIRYAEENVEFRAKDI